MKTKLHMMSLLGVVGLLLAAPFVSIAQASAQSNYDPISCGLWAGVNLNTANMTCSQSSSQSSTSRSTTSSATRTSPNAATTSGNKYVALGDSVAAGLGLPINSTVNAAQCGRSSQGYPSTVAAQTGLSLTNVTCSGATAGDLVTKQSVSGPNITAQLDQAFSGGTPRLITITAGANDANWANFIRACYATTCGGSAYQAAASAYLTVLSAKLQYVFSSIQARSKGTPPTVLITGYYNPLSSSCTAQQSNITGSEINWLSSETGKLNSTIQNASRQYASFVRYVPVSFAGHDICSSMPWVQGLSDKAPFHPTATGQQQIAQAVVSAYRSVN